MQLEQPYLKIGELNSRVFGELPVEGLFDLLQKLLHSWCLLIGCLVFFQGRLHFKKAKTILGQRRRVYVANVMYQNFLIIEQPIGAS